MTTPDDTYALQQAIDAAGSGCVALPKGPHYISAPLLLSATGARLVGQGMAATVLYATGDFDEVLWMCGQYQGVQDLSIVTTGHATRCVSVSVDACVERFTRVYLHGDLAGDLVHSNGQNLDFDACTWHTGAPETYAFNLDCFNQNAGLVGCRVGGIGRGGRVTNTLTPGLNRVEGLKIAHSYFINTGRSNLEIGNSYMTLITGTVLDQSSATALAILEGADGVQMVGGYLGSKPNLANTIGVYLHPDAGGGHDFARARLACLDYGVYADASTVRRIVGLDLSGLKFDTVKNPLILDSVAKCAISDCLDMGAPVAGSLNVKGTYGPGDYRGCNNRWAAGASAFWHAGSSYSFLNDTRG